MYMLYKKILLIIQNIKVMSENKFEYIDDVILNVDKDKVEKKKKSPIKPIALLILAAAILWYGANYVNTAQSDTLSSVVIMIGLAIAGWGIVAFLVKKERYVYKPTGKTLKKHKVYVAANQSSRLYDILAQNKYDDLQSLTRAGQSNLSLEAYCSEMNNMLCCKSWSLFLIMMYR